MVSFVLVLVLVLENLAINHRQGLQRVSNRARGRAGARARLDNAEKIALRRRRYGTDVYFVLCNCR